MSGEYYKGVCPVGGEPIYPGDKLSGDDTPAGRAWSADPHIVCPIHGCRVPLGVIPKEEHDEVYGKFEAAAGSTARRSSP